MTREEELKGLKAMYEEIAAIPDDEIFDYFYNNSPSFRNDFLNFVGETQFSVTVGLSFEFKEMYSISYTDSCPTTKMNISEGSTCLTAA